MRSLQPGSEHSARYESVDSATGESDGPDAIAQEENVEDRQMWTSRILTKSCFVAFGATFATFIVVLVVLYVWSSQHQGLTATRESLHYLWTYGPTAILTILAAFWSLVEFRTKQLAPWKVMLDGPATAQNTICLDYLSPWNVTVLWSSLRQRNFPVSIAVAGSLLLKLLIVVSTGLFALQPMVLQDKAASLITLDSFDGQGFQNASIDSRPTTMDYAIKAYGAEYPLGTTAHYAYQTFNSSHSEVSSNVSLTGEVDVFHGGLSCNVLLDNVTMPLETQSNHTFQVDSSTRVTISAAHDGVDLHIDRRGCQISAVLREDSWRTLLPDCDSETLINFTSDGDLSVKNTQELFLQTSKVFRHRNSRSRVLTIVHCAVDYGIYRSNLTIQNQLDPVVHLDVPQSPERTKRKLAGISNSDILTSVRKATHEMPQEEVPKTGFVSQNSMFFNLMNVSSSEPFSSAMLGGEVVKTSAEDAFNSISAQVARNYLLKPSHDPLTGTSISSENRLVMQSLSFGLMVGILGLLLAASVGLFFTAPRAVCSRDPSSIGGLATVVATSKGLQASFEDTGSWDNDSIDRATASRLYRTEVVPGPSGDAQFSICGSDEEPLLKAGDHDKTETGVQEWWRPFSVTIPAQVIWFLLPAGMIVALEVLLQHSKASQAFTMFGVNVMYGMMDFGARVFQPYSLLRRQAVPASVGILNQQLGKLSLSSLYESVRQGQAATAATSIAVVAGVLLPIAVSGLYTAQATTHLTPITAYQVDSFNFSVLGGLGDPLSRPSLILHSNMSSPQWTYEDLALSAIKLPNGSGSGEQQNKSISYTVTLKIPAARTQTNCTALEGYQHRFSESSYEEGVKLDISLPEHCLYSKNSLNRQELFSFDFPYSYFGRMDYMLDLQWSVDIDNCGTYIATTGFADEEMNTTATILLCNPYFETVDVEATFELPNLATDRRNPPRIDEKSSRVHKEAKLSIEFDGSLWKNFMPEIHIRDYPYPTNYDGIFSAVVHGVDGILPPELLDLHNIPRLQDSVQRVYGIMEAQRANFQYRQKSPQPPVAGTLRDPNRIRLVQSEVSTRILEALLGIMLLCAIVTFFAIDTKETLPKNPCSIAAQVSLLAGSEILSTGVTPPGSEWCSDAQLREKGVWEGLMISFGWWNVDEKRRFGIGIGDACGGEESDYA
ncbi:hypothetical protein N7457_006335 [Penicillium paradoxum]|uniref:uncharacterized protein n=1 Tax=Penicillium paradoxum TaxID=176176 RepID=UPI002547C01B|nr:uncharacterized protein N7457_006335 [Penicillium paradoxum]KAJ5781175.1 hypothetical protein N7457_006335 [Penicillium paradoxum]